MAVLSHTRNQELSLSSKYIHNLSPLTIETAAPAQREVLEQAIAQVGFLPNMYANMAHVPAVLEVYLQGYGRFRTASGLSPAEQEVVLLAISLANECDYCTAAHSMMAKLKSGVPEQALEAIRSKQPIADPRLHILFELARDMTESRGRPCPKRAAAFLEAGFTESHILFLILAISAKTLSNYTNHAFDTPLDKMFQPYQVG